MASAQEQHKEDDLEKLINDYVKQCETKKLNDDESAIEKLLIYDSLNLLKRLSEGKVTIPVRYHDPDQTPLSRDSTRGLVIRNMALLKIGYHYNPYTIHLLINNYISAWMQNIYLGNYAQFMYIVEKMNKEELERHLNMRETILQVGAIFHAIIGATHLVPGSKTLLEALAVYGSAELEHMMILEKLLELGANVNVHCLQGETPLIYCITKDSVQEDTRKHIINLLMKHGADLNATTRMGITALMKAICCNNSEYVQLLINHRANPYAKDITGVNAFEMAFKFNPGLIKHLIQFSKEEIIQAQADAEEKDNYKRCGICRRRSTKRCSGCLLEHYCSVKCQTKHWDSHCSTCMERKDQLLAMPFVKSEMCSTSSQFILSVLIPDEGSFLDNILLIHDEHIKVKGVVYSESPTGSVIAKVVRKQGFHGFMGFFYAKKEDNAIKIHPKIIPPQMW